MDVVLPLVHKVTAKHGTGLVLGIMEALMKAHAVHQESVAHGYFLKAHYERLGRRDQPAKFTRSCDGSGSEGASTRKTGSPSAVTSSGSNYSSSSKARQLCNPLCLAGFAQAVQGQVCKSQEETGSISRERLLAQRPLQVQVKNTLIQMEACESDNSARGQSVPGDGGEPESFDIFSDTESPSQLIKGFVRDSNAYTLLRLPIGSFEMMGLGLLSSSSRAYMRASCVTELMAEAASTIQGFWMGRKSGVTSSSGEHADAGSQAISAMNKYSNGELLTAELAENEDIIDMSAIIHAQELINKIHTIKCDTSYTSFGRAGHREHLDDWRSSKSFATTAIIQEVVHVFLLECASNASTEMVCSCVHNYIVGHVCKFLFTLNIEGVNEDVPFCELEGNVIEFQTTELVSHDGCLHPIGEPCCCHMYSDSDVEAENILGEA